MVGREIWHELVVNTSQQHLYDSVAKPENLAHWWTTGARGEVGIGGHLEFWFGDFCASIAEITLLKPGELVRWHITGGAATDWLDTDIEFKIFRDMDRTIPTSATRTGRRTQNNSLTALWAGPSSCSA